MIVYDFEVFKYDWLICYLDTKTRKMHHVVNDRDAFRKMYDKYKDEVWVGYNSRGYDQWIAKGILCDFDPFEISKFIIEKKRKGWEFSNLLHKFPIYNYDTMIGFRSLKELEGFMGHDIQESDVSFKIQRPLTDAEIKSTIFYCEHDVMETFEVLVNKAHEYESHVGLLQEFDFPLKYMSKTKAQLSASILGAKSRKHNDEFEITIVDTLKLDKYNHVRKWYDNWIDSDHSDTKVSYGKCLKTEIAGVPHVFAFGGIHGALPKYYGEGFFVMADVASYYPALMIEYEFLSRNVSNKSKYEQIRDERIIMKLAKDPRQQPRKIVLNSTFGASKDRFNHLYDPLQANNICINGQLLLLDLIEKLEHMADLIQSNTDGVLFKLRSESDYDEFVRICELWSKRTRMDLDYEKYTKVIQRDVNNYILVDEFGDVKTKGGHVKKLDNLDNDLPIVNRAIVDYFVNSTPVENTVNGCDDMIMFQKITKIGGMYEYVFKENSRGDLHKYTTYKTKQKVRNKVVVEKWKESVDDSKYGKILNTKVNRCFASKLSQHGMLLKKKEGKTSLDKIGSTPDKCFIWNKSVVGMKVPSYLDKAWYIKLAKDRIKEFIG